MRPRQLYHHVRAARYADDELLKLGITGATGFLGSHLVCKLPELGPFNLRALTRTLSRTQPTDSRTVEWMQGDLAMADNCVEFVRGLDVIVHLAHANTPLTSDRHLPGDVQASLLPSLNLIEAIRAVGTRPHVVFASSGGSIYADCGEQRPHQEDDPCVPQSSYGIQKLAIELYLHLAARKGWLTATSLRIGNAYGSLLPAQRKQGFIGVALSHVVRGEPIPIFGNPDNIRDYVHIDDVARAFALAATPRKVWNAFNIGSGRGLSVLDILHAIESILGGSVPVQFVESSSPADQLIPWSVLDIGRAKRELGWAPVIAFEDGIRSLLNEHAH